MANYNKIIIIGNLTKEPNYKQLNNGQAICTLTIASNRDYKNKQTGALVKEVCFIDVDVWGPQAEHCRQYLQKGRPVLIEGRLKQDNWNDAEGKARQIPLRAWGGTPAIERRQAFRQLPLLALQHQYGCADDGDVRGCGGAGGESGE